MTEVFDALEAIAATSSKKEKEALVAQHLDNPIFDRVVKAAYDPFITYGINKVPEPDPSLDGEISLHESCFVWDVLDRLARRELTGNLAKATVAETLGDLDEKSREVVRRILIKDLRAGFTAGTVNRAKPGTITVFSCMLAHKYEEKHVKSWPVFVEPKLDGVRVLTVVQPLSRAVNFYSRSGKEFTSFDHLKPKVLDLFDQNAAYVELFSLDGFVLDAEVVSGNFNETVSQVRKKDVAATDAELHVFDAFPLSVLADIDYDKHFVRRRTMLMEFIVGKVEGIKVTECSTADTHEEVMEIYANYRAQGLEGAMVKAMDGLYQKKRSRAWLKIKNEESVDVPIVGVFEGTGKYEGILGGLIVDVDGVEVRVGGGLSDQQRQEFWDHQDDLMGRLIEVEYHEKTPDGSLRHPRFVRFRDDKDI